MGSEPVKRDGFLSLVPGVVDRATVGLRHRYGLDLRDSQLDDLGMVFYYCNERSCLLIMIDRVERTLFVRVLNIAGRGEWWQNGPVLSLDHALKLFAPGTSPDYSGCDPRNEDQLMVDLTTKLQLLEQYLPETLNGDFSKVPESALT